MIDKDLQIIGLQEKEAKVYLAALELGKGTAQQIAAKADVKRPTTYVIMDDLMRQGLVSSFYEGKKQYFVAENPERLTEILENRKRDVEKQQKQLNEILPQLKSINNRDKDKPVVKYYEGREGILTMVNECNKKNFGKKMFLFRNYDMFVSLLGEDLLVKIADEREKSNVSLKQIYSSKEPVSPGINFPNAEDIWVSNNQFPIDSDIAIYSDRIRIIDFKKKLIGVVIESREIAESFKTMHELAWKYLQSQSRKD
jgi:sugar-specific transcriptional regulator TrmB